MRKRILSALLCLVMAVGLLPTAALATVGRSETTVTQTYRFYVGGVTETATPYHTETIQSGETLPDPGVPTGDGEFLGWYIDDEELTQQDELLPRLFRKDLLLEEIQLHRFL